MAHDREILTSSISVEWFTPPEILNLVREVLGTIDLDPASCETANQLVQAEQYFTQADNGLTKEWHGKVFLNPPYGKHGQKQWSRRMVDAYLSKEIEEGILLVNSATGNKWFKPLKEFPICFPDFRIKFISGMKESPTHSNALVYFGDNVELFAEKFGTIGAVMKKIS